VELPNIMMASTSTSASTSSTSRIRTDEDQTDRQAGPLPVKVGELGFSGDALTVEQTTDPSASTETLAGPHPTERARDQQHLQITQRPTNHHHNESSSSSTHPASSTTTLPLLRTNGTSSVSLAPTTSSFSSIKRRLKFLAPSPISKSYLFGATPRSVLRLSLQLTVLGATVAGWVLGVRYFKLTPASPAPGDNTTDNSNVPVSGSIFIHVAFTVATLIQLLFLERCIFHLRAERFVYLHPESALPSHLNRGPHANSRMPYAPWNRPALPTYAAALGFRGTGDAEDNEIARVVAIGSGDVPPQYGNTRGSTLLAYGIGGLPARTSVASQMSEWQQVGHAGANSGNGTPVPSRPVSYGQSEQIEDALRANQLEAALARLESGGRSGRSS